MDVLLHRIGWSVQAPSRRARRAADRPVAGRSVADGGNTAGDPGAWICFEGEAGQGLRPPKGTAWERRGHTPVVRVTARGTHRVSLAAFVAVKPGDRPHLF
ncbi:hypothetical protein [Actinomadura formosensis]|uniref:hypothetical protein n=1 Tax=Actinomadura formosensis TaxID=60706 RepID=UPI003D8ABEDE